MTTHLRDNAPSHFVTTDQQALADQAYRFFQSEFHHLNAEIPLAPFSGEVLA